MKKDTVIRTIVLLVALVNQILVATGHSIIPVGEDQLVEYISLTFTIVTALIAWWKNNSFTKEAVKADEYMHQLKELN